jgi:mannose-6-phosphate isomerase-like protein (cupin superfamily)
MHIRNVDDALAQIPAPWQPHRLTSINDYDVKLAKFEGEFIWHTHEETDEFFMVISGRITIQLRDQNVEMFPNDVYVVEKGVEHRPVSHGVSHVLMFEPKGTVNTGNVGGERTEPLREL